MITKHLPTLLAAALIGMTASHGQSILLGGYDGSQTQTAVGSTSQTLVSGVRQLTGAKQDAGAVGAVTTRIWTDQTTNKELQWGVYAQSTTTGNWGLTDFTTDASTASAGPDTGARWVATQAAASWINFEITNTGTNDVTLDKFHISARRTNTSALPTGAPDTLTISLEQNGTFANPPVLSSSNLTAFGTQTINLNATTTWDAYEFALTSMLSDLTLAPNEKATFRIANNAGGNRLYLDNIAISGTVNTGPVGTVDATNSTVVASPTSILANGTSTSTITVTLKDAAGVPVGGEGVTLAKTSGPGTPTISPSSTLTTNGSGVATFTVSSSTVGTQVFTATSSINSVVVTQTASVDFQSTLVDAASSTVSASPTAVPANGTTTSTITVTLKNSSGTPLSGKVVSLAGNGSATIATSNNTSNASGVVTFTVKSGTVGIETFTATSESVAVTQTANVDFQTLPVAGPVSAGMSTVVASPTTIAADGTAISTITVTLKDATGLAVANEGVLLAKTSGPGTPVINPAGAQITNTSGVATFTVSSTTAGTGVFTATTQTDNVVVTQTASVTFTQVGASFLVALLNDPVAATTSAIPTSPLANFYDGSEKVTDVGTTNNRGNAFVATGVDSDGVSGTNAHTVVYDMGKIVAFDGFVHAQRKADGFDDVASINFWVTNTNPGDAAATIPLPILASAPNDTVNLARNTGVLTEYLLPGGKLTGRYVVMRLNSARTSGANPGGFSLLFGQTANVGDFDTWQGSYPGLGAAGGDDDGDGLTNDEERIFGLNPQNGGSSNPYAVPFNRATGTFSYTRRTQALTGLTYKIWYSTDLVNWFWESGASQTPRTPVGEVEIVDVTIDPTLLTQPKLFLQVSAEDLGPPPVLSSLWGSNTTITLNFSEAMEAFSATNPANYIVNQDGGGSIAISGASLSGDGKTVILTLASALSIDSAFTVTMNRIANGAGQPLINGTSGQFRTWDNDPNGIKVFILAGQSNMVGYGHSELGKDNVAGAIGTLRYLAVNDATYPEYNYTSLLADPGQPTTSPWKTRNDVKVWWHNGSSGSLGGPISKGDLGPPFQGANANWFGPEYAFGQVIGDHYATDDVLIIKAAWGGHTLVGNFRPPSAVAKRGGVVGASYQAIFNDAREVLLNLGTVFPEWSGRGYQIVGFAWHQGTSDKAPDAVASEYKDNLPDFISDVRAEFGKPNLPFVIATAGMQQNGLVELPPYTGYTKVERAQLWVYPDVPKPAYVLSEDTRGFHETVANSPTDQSFHWNHNARSYFRVGLSLGNNMKTLLTTP